VALPVQGVHANLSEFVAAHGDRGVAVHRDDDVRVFTLTESYAVVIQHRVADLGSITAAGGFVASGGLVILLQRIYAGDPPMSRVGIRQRHSGFSHDPADEVRAPRLADTFRIERSGMLDAVLFL